ncbi:hypothetical protein OH76DRAFT_1523769 [Lentinus brumalis]|uniref:Uncharacterized protein n=1 Tax=Lentinus brumalis TaxID=2498619 RepID=A0A371D564_9APHY|nr:hypothetical protein OH76DRAFT_1523769 [Polyporus brumalis]
MPYYTRLAPSTNSHKGQVITLGPPKKRHRISRIFSTLDSHPSLPLSASCCPRQLGATYALLGPDCGARTLFPSLPPVITSPRPPHSSARIVSHLEAHLVVANASRPWVLESALPLFYLSFAVSPALRFDVRHILLYVLPHLPQVQAELAFPLVPLNFLPTPAWPGSETPAGPARHLLQPASTGAAPSSLARRRHAPGFSGRGAADPHGVGPPSSHPRASDRNSGDVRDVEVNRPHCIPSAQIAYPRPHPGLRQPLNSVDDAYDVRIVRLVEFKGSSLLRLPPVRHCHHRDSHPDLQRRRRSKSRYVHVLRPARRQRPSAPITIACPPCVDHAFDGLCIVPLTSAHLHALSPVSSCFRCCVPVSVSGLFKILLRRPSRVRVRHIRLSAFAPSLVLAAPYSVRGIAARQRVSLRVGLCVRAGCRLAPWSVYCSRPIYVGYSQLLVEWRLGCSGSRAVPSETVSKKWDLRRACLTGLSRSRRMGRVPCHSRSGAVLLMPSTIMAAFMRDRLCRSAAAAPATSTGVNSTFPVETYWARGVVPQLSSRRKADGSEGSCVWMAPAHSILMFSCARVRAILSSRPSLMFLTTQLLHAAIVGKARWWWSPEEEPDP